MCRTWIYRKISVSDNRGNYENRSYLRCLLAAFKKVDCSGRYALKHVVDPEDPIQNDALAVTWTTLYTGAPVHSQCVEFIQNGALAVTWCARRRP